MYVVVGENWWYGPGVGELRKAETAAAWEAQGGKDDNLRAHLLGTNVGSYRT